MKLYLQLNEPGSGEISVPLDSAAAADLTSGSFVELKYRGTSHGGFFVENITKVLVGSEENASRWKTATGRGMLAMLDEAIVWDWMTPALENTRKFVGVPKGEMLYKLLDEAENHQINPSGDHLHRFCFHVGGLETGAIMLTWDFTETQDSLGNAWTDSEDMEFRVGTSLLDVLRQIAALGIDFDIERDNLTGVLLLHAYKNGLGTDLSGTVHFRIGLNCTEVSDDEAGGEIRNAVLVEFSDPAVPYTTVEDAASMTAYRRRENLLQAANASDLTTAGKYGLAEITSLKDPKHAITLKISDAVGPQVFNDYNLGDWINFDDGTGTEVKYRVRGIQLEWNDQWYADVVVELNDTFMETQIRNARDLRKVGGASSGSSLMTPQNSQQVAIDVSGASIATHDANLNAHGGSPRSTALDDFQVGDGAGAWIKKTLAQVKTILSIPVKATGAELDTGTDDAKFATAKAIKDSHNVPSVVPSTAGKVMMSNGADWISAPITPAIGGQHLIQDEGGNLTARSKLNFVGAGVVATDDPGNDATVVTIPRNGITYIDQAGGTGDTYGVLVGVRDGANTEFTVSQGVYSTGSLSVYLNGQLLTQGSAEDWHEHDPATGKFHFEVAPTATDEITVVYGIALFVAIASASDTDPLDCADIADPGVGVPYSRWDHVHRVAANVDWMPGSGTWTWSSSDAPTYVISVDNDQTAILSVGKRIRLTHAGAVKYFIVTAVGAYSGGVTLITVYGGTDYTLASSAITLPYYSSAKAPLGFPLSPAKWMVEVKDTTHRSQASPAQNVWYNLGAVAISIPIGDWFVSYQAVISYGAALSVWATLSTGSNSETDKEFTAVANITTVYDTEIAVTRNKYLTCASKTTYYLNEKTEEAGVANILLRSDIGTTVLRAVCAYL